MVKIVKTHFGKKAQKYLTIYGRSGYKLKSATMVDLATEFNFVFEKDENNKKYEYILFRSHFAKKTERAINDYEQIGYKVAFHLSGDLATENEVIFVKEIK